MEELEAGDEEFGEDPLPGADGFDVIEAVGPDKMPSVVFVTAYDRCALRALRRPRAGL